MRQLVSSDAHAVFLCMLPLEDGVILESASIPKILWESPGNVVRPAVRSGSGLALAVRLPSLLYRAKNVPDLGPASAVGLLQQPALKRTFQRSA